MKLRLVDIRSLLAAKRTELGVFGDTLTDPILSPEQKSKLDALETEIRGLEEREQIQVRLEEQIKKHAADTPNPTDAANDPDARSGKPHITTDNGQPGKVYRGERPFAQQLEDIRALSYPTTAPEVREKAANRLEQVMRSANESVDSQGGYLVQPDVATDIKSLQFTFSDILGKITPLPLSGDTNSIDLPFLMDKDRKNLRFGGVDVGWVKEGGVIPQTEGIALEMLSLKLKGLAAIWSASNQILRHAAIVETFARNNVAMALAFEKVSQVLYGAGTYGPLGFFASKAKITVPKLTGQAAKSVLFENIVAMNARLWPASQANAAWYVNPDVMAVLPFMQMAIGLGGQAVYLPSDGAVGAPLGKLYGKPVQMVEHCKTLGTEGDIILADFSQYGMIEQGGVRTDVSIHVFFDTDKQAFRFIEELDGAPLWSSAVTPFEGTTTLSPFITLATRS